MTTGKKYGLIIPHAKNALFAKKNSVSVRPSVFGDDSSSDEDAHKGVNAQIHREALKKKVRKQTKLEIQRALEQDSTVYEYDSIYDDMKEKSKKKIPANVAKADKQRKPKYINNLLKAAEKRGKERERMEDRKIQREREKEGDEFNDKEEFVTSAYRQKILERKQEIEEEKRMDAIEEALDVRKQRDLTGFYRNFLNRELCEEPNEGNSTETGKSTASEPTALPHSQDDEDTDLSFSSDEDQHEKSSTPERQPSPIENHTRNEKQGRHKSHSRDGECVTQRERSRARDNRKSYDRHDQSPDHRPQNRGSDAHRRSPSGKHDRDKHSHRRSRERDHRSPHESHRHRRHDRDTDEKSSSRDQPHRKRQKRHDRDRSSSRSPSRSPIRSKDPRTPDHSSKARGGPPEHGAAADETGTVQGPMVDDKITNSFVKRTDKDKALSARDRYLARKAAQQAKPVIDSD